jgi:very-short-patch-repair endonuclease
MSLPEVLLWRVPKGRKMEGLHFRKQHPVGPYVLDFYCDARKLAVEVDGGSHGFGDRPDRDDRRDAWLAERGVRTLRVRSGLGWKRKTETPRA